MEFTKFSIKNFRGIRNLTLDLSRSPQANTYTFVGLNESGKTTILEAISCMGRKPLDLAQADPTTTRITDKDFQSYIPVSQRYNFNGKVELTSWFSLTELDVAKITQYLEKRNFQAISINTNLEISRVLTYENSELIRQQNLWSFTPLVKKKGGKSFSFTMQKQPQEWVAVVEEIEANLLPQVLYFKSELFSFPDRICVFEGAKKKGKPSTPINSFYCDVIQDILHAIDSTLCIKKHIVDRAKRGAASDQQNLESVLQRMSAHITAQVMRQWELIFRRKLQDKRIGITCERAEDQSIFIRFKLHDGIEVFDLADRSAGFRWFFVFILLTQYRGYRNSNALFLYDEPASTLHSAAQHELLNCFKLVPKHFKVLYSTHSHHLISPEWLDATYIVKNDALSNETADVDFDSSKTDISATLYRTFVAQNPSSVSYFQPILDLLHYTPSPLIPMKPSVLVEGKSDFYVLRYLTSICFDITPSFDFIPCMGSGTSDQLIALNAGWGNNFLLLLDSDSEGTAQHKRYLEKFGSILNSRIIDYGKIDSAWNNFAIEKIIGKENCKIIHDAVFPEQKYSKKKFALAVQELLLKKQKLELSADLRERTIKLFGHLELALLI